MSDAAAEYVAIAALRPWAKNPRRNAHSPGSPSGCPTGDQHDRRAEKRGKRGLRQHSEVRHRVVVGAQRDEVRDSVVAATSLRANVVHMEGDAESADATAAAVPQQRLSPPMVQASRDMGSAEHSDGSGLSAACRRAVAATTLEPAGLYGERGAADTAVDRHPPVVWALWSGVLGPVGVPTSAGTKRCSAAFARGARAHRTTPNAYGCQAGARAQPGLVVAGHEPTRTPIPNGGCPPTSALTHGCFHVFR